MSSTSVLYELRVAFPLQNSLLIWKMGKYFFHSIINKWRNGYNPRAGTSCPNNSCCSSWPFRFFPPDTCSSLRVSHFEKQPRRVSSIVRAPSLSVAFDNSLPLLSKAGPRALGATFWICPMLPGLHHSPLAHCPAPQGLPTCSASPSPSSTQWQEWLRSSQLWLLLNNWV